MCLTGLDAVLSLLLSELNWVTALERRSPGLPAPARATARFANSAVRVASWTPALGASIQIQSVVREKGQNAQLILITL